MRRLWVVPAMLLFLSSAAGLRADPGAAAADDFDPTKLIGLDLKSAMSQLGVPQSLYTYRGHEADQDNVVFYYSNYLYLFWYQDRVWQVRCDRRFTHALFGLTLGTPRDVVLRSFSRPLAAREDSLYFDIDDSEFPLRARLVFADDVLSDVYVYRSDF